MPKDTDSESIKVTELRDQAVAELKAKLDSGKPINFDPQGRVMIEVTIPSSSVPGFSPASADTTLVSLDLDSVSGAKSNTKTYKDLFKDKFIASVSASVSEKDKMKLKGALQAYTESSFERGSVIPLHQEMAFHLSAARRVMEEVFKDQLTDKDESIEQAYKAAETALNEEVLKVFAQGLIKATGNDNKINVAKLNAHMDKARGRLGDFAQTKLMDQLKSNQVKLDVQTLDLPKGTVTKKELNKQIKKLTKEWGVEPSELPDEKQMIFIQEASFRAHVAHAAVSITATNQDILHIDSQAGLLTVVKGTEETAHNRKKTKKGGDEVSFAHRQILTYNIDDEGDIREISNPRIQIRTASLALKEGVSDKEAIADVALKFEEITRHYDLAQKLEAPSPITPKAFIYNLHTANNDNFDGKNKQTESARHILKGMHAYNKEQVENKQTKAPPVFALVQNISVNNHGDKLGYTAFNSLKNETTLMSEMAMLHTVYDTLNDSQKQEVNTIFKQYQTFLEKPKSFFKPAYFSNSREGQSAIDLCKKIKKSIQVESKEEINGKTPPELAKTALKQLMANNAHSSHANAKTIQALSIYSEEASIAGCKSGNERAEAINKRVTILDCLDNHKVKDKSEMKALKDALQKYSAEPSQANMTALNTALDKAVNQLAVYTAAGLISQTDQHSGAKVDTPISLDKETPDSVPDKKGGVINTLIAAGNNAINTNHSESADLKNLKQSKAGKNQAHKGFFKNFMAGVNSNFNPKGEELKQAYKAKNSPPQKLPKFLRPLYKKLPSKKTMLKVALVAVPVAAITATILTGGLASPLLVVAAGVVSSNAATVAAAGVGVSVSASVVAVGMQGAEHKQKKSFKKNIKEFVGLFAEKVSSKNKVAPVSHEDTGNLIRTSSFHLPEGQSKRYSRDFLGIRSSSDSPIFQQLGNAMPQSDSDEDSGVNSQGLSGILDDQWKTVIDKQRQAKKGAANLAGPADPADPANPANPANLELGKGLGPT